MTPTNDASTPNGIPTPPDDHDDVDALPDGSGTDAESSVDKDDDTDTASGGDAD